MSKKKLLFYFLLFIFFFPTVLFAQLAMNLKLNRKSYLRHECIYAKVLLRNLSAHPLVFGSHSGLKGHLWFDIVSPSGKKAALLTEKYSAILGKVLPPGKTESLIIPLSKMYNIDANGEYTVKAVVEHSLLSDSYQSNTVDFKVTDGTNVWDAVVGVPTAGDIKDGTKIEKRKYGIKSFFDGINNVYCLVVEDNKFIYGVARIGYDIGNSIPACEIDSFSKIHILVQSSPQIYSYYVYDTDCHLDKKEIYKKSNTDPCLVRDTDSGNVFVAGGEKAREGTDYLEANDRIKE